MFENESNELKAKDEKLARVIDELGDIDFSWAANDDYFQMLCRSIVFQQLSTKAAITIWNRVKERTPIAPKEVLTADLDGVGLSNQKKTYLKDLAEKFAHNHVRTDFLNMTNQEIIDELVKVKGIGQWSVEMFLMFSLKRLDVFSAGDLGLRKAVQTLYGFEELPKPKRVEELSRVWAPYRTLAALYLWKMLD
ncbi:DNA-3-methyladenine glycosylase 2 family protein [archaeon CG10_big_fil_rev_8_21_14_0_10_43_11]|nr:MAG: DNA-3-methyladenine glycosylase 2 family protein [archaeon CG10_big_fil_rev_8_21_14_0_10_43_11]